MRFALSARVQSLVLNASRHVLLLLCVGAVVVGIWASRQMARLDFVSQHPAFHPADSFLVDSVREATDLPGLKAACVQLAARAELGAAAERRENAMAMTMIHSYFKAALTFSAISAVLLLVAWVAAGAVLRARKTPPPG